MTVGRHPAAGLAVQLGRQIVDGFRRDVHAPACEPGGRGGSEMNNQRMEIEGLAAGFADVADAYDRGRPGWPTEAVTRLIGFAELEPGDQVLDLAAGTGKLTRE